MKKVYQTTAEPQFMGRSNQKGFPEGFNAEASPGTT